jgi:hypothetical protein
VRKVSQTKIDISELKSEGGDVVKELAQLIREKTKAKVETAADSIIVKDEGKTISRTYLRLLLRKFLHQQGLKDHFRVIGGKENTLIVKEIKMKEEE